MGAAKVVTAANCFAHIEDVHAIVEGVIEKRRAHGVSISVSGLPDRPAGQPGIRHRLS